MLPFGRVILLATLHSCMATYICVLNSGAQSHYGDHAS
nr:hypothetical protein Q903MT_gene1204 [Picea sitchensis]